MSPHPSDAGSPIAAHERGHDRRLDVNRRKAFAIVLLATMLGCRRAPKGNTVLDHQHIEEAISRLRAAYAAFNSGDIDAGVQIPDPGVEWIKRPNFRGAALITALTGQSSTWLSRAPVPPKSSVSLNSSSQREIASLSSCTPESYRKAAVLGRRYDWPMYTRFRTDV